MKIHYLLLAFIVSGQAIAKPVINSSKDVRGGISRTIIENWKLSDDDKKNIARLSSISAVAVAPTATIRKGSWSAVNSKHTACFYNMFGSTQEGRYAIRMNIGGKEVNAFDKIPVGAGQGFCITRYLEMWVNGIRNDTVPSVAYTHVEMDGQSTDNEGHGAITVR